MVQDSHDSMWWYWVRLGVKAAVVLGVFYVTYHFYERNRIKNMTLREEPAQIKLPDDAYVFVPKSYVVDMESAQRKLIGKPLWVKEGFRWAYQPGDRLFGPLERIVPTRVSAQGGEARIHFSQGGKEASFVIGRPDRVLVDDIFFIKDPMEIYDHWTEEQWSQVEDGVVEVGMSEIQIGFALGVGQVVRQSPGAATRILEYRQCKEAGLAPVRVTYKRHVAAEIEPIED